MKLIELLVQETKNGNFEWPDGVPYVEQFIDLSLFCSNIWKGDHQFKAVDDYARGRVTREQYEAALAAAHQPVWNGEGLPPVGTGCECHLAEGLIQSIVVGYDFGEKAVVMRNLSSGKYFSVQSCADFIKPIRSEADKKRNAAISAIDATCLLVRNDSKTAAAIYDAIAAGEIPGVAIK